MTITEIIDKRIDDHIKEHDGLYSDDEIKILKPIWKTNLLATALKNL